MSIFTRLLGWQRVNEGRSGWGQITSARMSIDVPAGWFFKTQRGVLRIRPEDSTAKVELYNQFVAGALDPNVTMKSALEELISPFFPAGTPTASPDTFQGKNWKGFRRNVSIQYRDGSARAIAVVTFVPGSLVQFLALDQAEKYDERAPIYERMLTSLDLVPVDMASEFREYMKNKKK